MSTTIFGLSNVVNAYKQKLFKLGTHLTAKGHFTETAVISTNPSTPPRYYQFEWSREKDESCKNYYSFLPREKTHTTHKPVFIPGYDLHQPALFPVPAGDSHLFSSEINYLHHRAKRTHAHAHTDTYAPLDSQEGLHLIKDTGTDHLLQC